ncbi:DnaT-like ssDNA-binding domain-containing protein [uncultured Thalassolituus sp.]|uniref:DnaT-like ssDNA-binding domain-containing protein n=1 Tax=uncultured Thalassolituus sp. TaxID=285273 RepID=UPI002605452C|nr:DnaT-like ssDNA-binding domain-containing protein [uncultured Thalassolituus sp.]
MPSHPLFSDHTISLSATLAATIGLEEAVLLTVLNDAARLQSQPQARLNNDILRQQLPFWDDVTIRRVLRSLTDKGLLRIQGPMFPDAGGIIFHFGDEAATPASRPATTPQPARSQSGTPTSAQPAPARPAPMPQKWQPAEDTLQRLEQHGVPRAFSCAQLDAFVLQGQEQGSNRNDWNTRFFRHVKNQWVYTQNDASRFRREQERTAFNPVQDEARPITGDWRPSPDAHQILSRAGIDPQFIDDAVPEFILYWSERGDVFKTWNSKFIQHVRQQWARYTAAVEHSPMPVRIDAQWQPAEDCYDILKMGHIPRDFASSLVPEFVLYWRDSNQVHNSWNSRFLQYVKQQWGKRLAQKDQPTGEANGQQTGAQPGYTTAQASVHRLSDTSWAK